MAGAAKAGENDKFVRTRDGVILYPDARTSGGVQAVRLQVIRGNIIRVTASPEKTFPDPKSLMITFQPQTVKWTLEEKGGSLVLKAPGITANILKQTGAVSFTDPSGKPLIAERSWNGRAVAPVVFEGQPSWSIRQTFESGPDDGFFGLGQHQESIYNYKGQQVFLWQNNTEVAVPFLLGARNYGVLWDNYSYTLAGDARELMPLSRLRLFDKNGKEGWLTASYSNDRKQPENAAFTKAESLIDYAWLDDTKKLIPEGFPLQDGAITWEGNIVSGFSGDHLFRVVYGGYVKIWLDGKLLADNWRQAWNPASVSLQLPLEKDRKHHLKIQWTPDGTASYLTVKWLPPAPAADRDAFTFASQAGRQLDYYCIAGKNADEVIAGYRTLTGKAPLMPRWAMGFWQSRERYKTQEEVLQTAAEFRRRGIPLDNIVQDWSYWKEDDWGSQDFDPARFPDADAMIRDLHGKYNTRVMISVWPKVYEGIDVYRQFDRKGWLYARNIADRQRDWIGQGYVSTFYDAFNADARRGFWDLLHTKLYKRGIDAWWMDASEPDILSNVSPEKRLAQMTPLSAGIAAEYLNAYPLENARGIYEGQRAVDSMKRVFLLTRSGFAGSQRYAAAIWSGDIGSRWEDMKAQIMAGVNFSLSGLPYWTMDIGGFAVERRYELGLPSDTAEWRELQARWFQFGTFVPLFRAHGQFPFREVFNIAPEGSPAYETMLYYNKLRYRLMPYIYSLAGMTYHRDYTMMRGLVMDFPNDKLSREIGDQYMFGPSLLISPVYAFGAREKELYLPAGQGWYDLYAGKYEEGGKRIRVDAPYERMPVYVKEGAILPAGPALQYTAEKPADTITLFVYTGKDAAFDIYEDEDTTYGYEKGRFSNIPLRYNESKGELTIGARSGRFPGMREHRIFRVIWVGKNRAHGFDPAAVADVETHYNGQEIRVKRYHQPK
ncbi:TIM-barrel domain-containing protein [Chitinophaga pollutisoli]|uniref:TIM-barrel domain-containing protein n=1 Tax=Chitinophaga pollutisoli TaxID=3133966 RepID=A0ABZ2YKQ5_9BACT